TVFVLRCLVVWAASSRVNDPRANATDAATRSGRIKRFGSKFLNSQQKNGEGRSASHIREEPNLSTYRRSVNNESHANWPDISSYRTVTKLIPIRGLFARSGKHVDKKSASFISKSSVDRARPLPECACEKYHKRINLLPDD